TIRLVLNEDPTPPNRLCPEVPADLETVCLTCLEKEPGRRYGCSAALADDLTRFLDGVPVSVAPVGERERLARHAARDGYEIVEEVGSGRRGTVYRAAQGPLRTAVALKVFRPSICSQDEWEARLRQAGERWAALAHPQVVAVHGAGW